MGALTLDDAALLLAGVNAAGAAEQDRILAEAARDAAIAAGSWAWNVDTQSDLAGLTPTLNDTAIVMDTMHVWRWDGAAWVDTGESALESKADRSAVALAVASLDNAPLADAAISYEDSLGRILAVITDTGRWHGLGATYAGDVTAAEAMLGALHMGGVTAGTEDIPGWSLAVIDRIGTIYAGVRSDGSGGSSYNPRPGNVDWVLVEPYLDPSRGLLVTWAVAAAADAGIMQYRPVGAETWMVQTAERVRLMPGAAGTRIYTAAITGLAPGTEYECYWPGVNANEFIRTARASDVRVWFASDFHTRDYAPGSNFAQMAGVFATLAPDLAVHNGDYVDDDGQTAATSAARWDGFLRALRAQYRVGDCLIPTIWTPGNHEGTRSGGGGTAMSGGNGIYGPLPLIASQHYYDALEGQTVRGAGWTRIGRELLIVSIETDHFEPLPAQVDGIVALIAREYGGVRHILINGHTVPFGTQASYPAWDTIDTQARTLRNLLWPALAPYAAKIRAYICGHEHHITATERLQVAYDPGLSAAQNDQRWVADPVGGIRQIGNGPWAAPLGTFDPARATALSAVDGSQRITTYLGRSGSTIYSAGISNHDGVSLNFQNVWSLDFGPSGADLKCIGLHGLPYITIAE